MTIEKKLYTPLQVGQIIKAAVSDIAAKMGENKDRSAEERSTILRQWAGELLPSVESAVVEEVVRRHVQGITLSVWAGPPGSGKGTNIDTANLLGKVYAEVTSQGVARVLEEPFHSMLLDFSIAQSVISTGTSGMFNRPEGEYVELFGELVPIVGALIADGGFAPDDMVSVLVELMILFRLTQNSHRIQIDLWPRTTLQFSVFSQLVGKVNAAQGKLTQEVVTIKVLKPEGLEVVKGNLVECERISKEMGLRIKGMLAESWYTEAVRASEIVTDPKERFVEEEKTLAKVFSLLEQEYPSSVGKAVIEELRTVCARMSFRFNLVISHGKTPRIDEFPLHVIRRLSVYTGETSPAFLEAVAKNDAAGGFYVVSSAGTPEEVISEILDVLAGKKSTDPRWSEVKKVAGEIAVAVVNQKELIVEDLVRRVGGILNS